MPACTVHCALASLLQPPLNVIRCSNKRVCAAPGADAGATYEKLAAVHLKLDSKHEAASSYMEAAKCYQKTDKKGALRSRLRVKLSHAWPFTVSPTFDLR